MESERVVIAIEPGSSKVVGAAALKNDDGAMKLLALYSVPSNEGVRCGTVYNLDTTSQAVVTVVNKLERLLDTRIDRVYLGLNGMSLHSVPVSVSRDLAEEENVITEDLLDAMAAESDEVQPESYLSLGVVSQEFRVDHKNAVEQNPKGVICSHVEGTFQRVLIHPRVVSKLMDCFKRANCEVTDSYIQPVAVAGILLSQDEKQRGCALVDYGAQTVTVSVFRGGKLCLLRVIPLGSDAITSDIASILKIDQTEAERLKKTYGLIGIDSEDVVNVGDRQIPLKVLSEICDARNEEILKNVFRQIRSTGQVDSLLSGIVFTGGGSSLAGLAKAVRRLIPEVKSVRVASAIPDCFELEEPSLDPQNGSVMGVLSMLNEGDDKCCELPKLVELDEEDLFEAAAQMEQGSLFNSEGESNQPMYEEQFKKHEEKKRQKEEAKRKKEEEKRQREAEKKLKEDKPKKSNGGLLGTIMNSLDKFLSDIE